MKEQIVYTCRVVSRNFVTDWMSGIKNISGGRLIAYEKMLTETLKDSNHEFTQKYPEATQIRMEITEFTSGALAIIIHGVIKNAD